MCLLAAADAGTSIRRWSLCFLGGVIGGIPNRIFVWFMGATGINAALGMKIAPAFTWPWVENALFWGGIFGLFFYPFLQHVKQNPILTGFLIGLLPSLNVLFYIFPSQLGVGVAGLQLGTLTPLFVIVANTFWGIPAAYWIRSGMSER